MMVTYSVLETISTPDHHAEVFGDTIPELSTLEVVLTTQVSVTECWIE